MKKAIITLFTVLSAFILVAQTPEAFKYQAVARDSVGNILINQNVSFQISILQGSTTGSAVYVETHEITTNEYGLVNLEIGHGTPVTGTLGGVNWASGKYFLQVEMDETGESNYFLMGTSQLLSVPYSLSTNRTESITVVDFILQLDSISNTIPIVGKIVFVLESEQLYLWDGSKWKTIAMGGCYPTPTMAYAGTDSTLYPGSNTIILQANTPVYGTGWWNIISGVGGILSDSTNPNAEFTGGDCDYYTLQWNIATACNTSTDQVSIDFNGVTTAYGGEDTTIFGTILDPFSITLNGTIPQSNETGIWTIEQGAGGSLDDPNNPTTSFHGITGISYLLKWTISNACNTVYDDVFIGSYQTCGVLTDVRDGQTYNTVQIGDQCWMAENLNIGTRIDGIQGQTQNTPAEIIEKYCFDDIESNCDTYGGLYQWDELMQYSSIPGVQGICPTGWHLPTDAEFTTLTDFLGGIDVAGGKMKEYGVSHWYPPNTGATNSSGFTALPGMRRETDGFNFILGAGAFFWSSDENDIYAWARILLFTETQVHRIDDEKELGYSARCLQD